MGPDSPLWLDRLAFDHNNLRAAFSWVTASDRARDGELAQRLVRALMWSWLMRGPFDEGVCWAERALSLDSGHALSQAGAVWVAGYLNDFVGSRTVARQMLEQGVSLCRRLGPSGKRELAWALNYLGMDAIHTNLATVQACFEESLDLWRQLGDPRGTAPALINLGYLASVEGDCDRASDLLENGLAGAQLSGERIWYVLAKINLGGLAAGQGHDTQAHLLYR
ncbi:MAG: tetratricopeptide repeat protein [Anaerolineales bacterium]|jgi:hypothetical protein